MAFDETMQVHDALMRTKQAGAAVLPMIIPHVLGD
jgi:hypothetical protein